MEIEENDLAEMVPLFRQFRAAPNSFLPTSKRCKVVPFAEVVERTDWRADRWWSYEERVDLGLDERKPVIYHLDFVTQVGNHASELHGLVSECRSEDWQPESYALRDVTLDDPIFSYVKKTTGWTKTQLHSLVGPEDIDESVPVYTAAEFPVGYTKAKHNNLISASDSSPAVSFAANGDGSAGRNFVLHNRPFYVTRDRTVVQITESEIDPSYVIYALRHMKARHGFDHTHKAVPKNLSKVSFGIPVMKSGVFNDNYF